MPRQLSPATRPKVQTAAKSSPRRPSNSEQENLIRLVSQIEEIEFPNESRRTSNAAVEELQVPFGRNDFDMTNEALPSAPSPDDLFTNRRTGTTTRQTAQQPQADAGELFLGGPSDEPDLGVLNFDDPPAAPSVDGARSRYQDIDPVVPDSENISPFATDDIPDVLEFEEPPTQAEPLPDPPALDSPPNFQAEAFRSLDADENDEAAVEDLPKSELGDFNGRDCEAENAKCDTSQEILRQIERSRVSVDISPSILPLEYDMAKVVEAREEKLAGAPSRQWRDRNGRLLAEGHLTDFRNTRIHVKTLDGTIRELVPSALSNEDWCFVTAWWDIPAECRFENEAYAMRDFRLSTLTWTAAGTCHKPLYFEEVYLERSGHSAGPILQPFISGAHFFGNIAMLPYHAGLNPPNECVYTLGHYRPGDCAPWFVGGFPMSTRGIRLEGLAWGAAIALLP
jgi:hypothetical protein